MRERIERAPVDCGDTDLLNYLIMRFAGKREEAILAIFVDRDRGYLGETTFATGTRHWVEMRSRTLFAHALALNGWGIILAHNHPSGDTRPSEIDIRTTQKIAEDGRPLEIELLDHFIVADNRVLSMRKAGLL